MDLTAARLRKRYTDVCAAGTIGSGQFAELANLARQCVPAFPDTGKAVSYVLYKLFDAIANDRDERSVGMSENSWFFEIGHRPIINALDFLDVEVHDPIVAHKLIAGLIAAEQVLVPQKG